MGERLSKSEFKKNGIWPESEVKRTFVEGLIKYGASEIHVDGRQNLAAAKTKLESGVPILGIGNHLSNAEGPLINSVLGKHDIKEPVFMLGFKLAKNPVTRALIGVANTIPVWPPTLEPGSEKEKDRRKQMNERAVEASKAALNGRHMLIVFPEGGRSYDEVLHQGLAQVAGYFQLAENLEVLPIGVWDTEKRLPRKRGWPHRGPVHLSFGELFKASDLPGFGERGRIPRQRAVDAAMRKIAELLPDKYKGYYSDSSKTQGSEQILVPGFQKILSSG